jgi:hypothetical protein
MMEREGPEEEGQPGISFKQDKEEKKLSAKPPKDRTCRSAHAEKYLVQQQGTVLNRN